MIKQEKSSNSIDILGSGLQTDVISHWCSLLRSSAVNPPLRPHLAFIQKHKVTGMSLCVCLGIRILVCDSVLTLMKYCEYTYCINVCLYVHVFAWYMLWYALLLIWVFKGVLREWHRIPCWDDPSSFDEGQWQGPQFGALCVNTASETWPQLIQLMTQRGMSAVVENGKLYNAEKTRDVTWRLNLILVSPQFLLVNVGRKSWGEMKKEP